MKPNITSRGILIPTARGDEKDDIANWKKLDGMLAGSDPDLNLMPVKRMTLAQAVAATGVSGDRVLITDYPGSPVWNWSVARNRWVWAGSMNLLQSGAQALGPDNLSKNEVLNHVVPGGLLGQHGCLLIEGLLTFTNNANNKNAELTFGGQVVGVALGSNLRALPFRLMIVNGATPSVQTANGTLTASSAGNQSTPFAGTVNTSQPQAVSMSFTKTNASDIAALNYISISALSGG